MTIGELFSRLSQVPGDTEVAVLLEVRGVGLVPFELGDVFVVDKEDAESTGFPLGLVVLEPNRNEEVERVSKIEQRHTNRSTDSSVANDATEARVAKSVRSAYDEAVETRYRRGVYYILEHPRRGCLRDLEETDSGRTGRFSVEAGRNDPETVMRFHTPEQAERARLRLPDNVARETQIRCSAGDGTYMGAWPVVEVPS